MDRKYLLVSALGHGALLGALWTMASYVEGNRNEVRAVDYAEKAGNAALDREMNELANIKAALEQGSGQDAVKVAASGPSAASREQQVKKTPEQMAEKIKELSQSIEQLRRETKADELSLLLKIPKEEALKKVEQRKPVALDAKSMTPAQLSGALGQMQRQARQALAARQEQQQRQVDGARMSVGGDGENTGFNGVSQRLGNGMPLPMGGALDLTDSSAAAHRDYTVAAKTRALDQGAVRPGTGRAIGRDGVYTSRVFIDTWYLLGPFAASNATRVSEEFPPEQLIDLDAVYLGKNRRLLKWQYTHFDRYPIVPPHGAENAVYYGYTEIVADRERDVWFDIGSDDDSKLWLNDTLVWTSADGMKPWYHDTYRAFGKEIAALNLTEGSRKVHLKKGRNTLLFKLYNGQAEMFFSLVLANSL
ncbi:hypothetical protein [Duganella sp. BJB476]|uniref:hypothetical protein n=1 Tax=Duganella sp. BJB476 TaxID=1871176 RepID=UPI000E3455B3|nr:hypothetical protein [Duganella sp. BJB476]RFP32801.1 hypothetical protein D0T21_11570 [Duganella sp. BJB476]